MGIRDGARFVSFIIYAALFHAKHIENAFLLWYTGKAFGVLAQLGERYAGSVEVRGSSPLSSTS